MQKVSRPSTRDLLSDFLKKLSRKKDIYKLYLAVQHHKQLISLFYKDYLDNSTTIFKAINIASTIAKPIITALKQKRIKPAAKTATWFPK